MPVYSTDVAAWRGTRGVDRGYAWSKAACATARNARLSEVGAARAAAGRSLSAADRDTLWQRLTETSAASVDDYRRLDSRLHLTIGQLVGTPTLVTLMADNRTRVNELLDHIPLLPRNIAHSNEQHETIVAAILRGSRDDAAAAMSEHLEGSAVLLRAFLS